ncbi:MAG: hypothetical protein ACFFE6_11985 [Candidatus Thorarchaeota archaeon]
MEYLNKRVFALTLVILLGSLLPIIHAIDGEISEGPRDDTLISQTSEYPPFEPPAYNASTINSGSVMINGQEIFWRYFYPNTSIMQPKNFRFSFEIWWENPDPNIVIVVDLSENEGESNSTSYYETILPYEKILETPEGEFIHYALWMNSTYFFMNETWASFGNEYIDEEILNLTVGIQHSTYFPIFEYTITRDTIGPIMKIIHPNYDELENKLILDWSNTSFQIEITGLSYIRYVKVVVSFLNQTTAEYDDIIIWPIGLELDEGVEPINGRYYVPSLITEKVYPDASGPADIDTDNPFPTSLVVLDGYGLVTSKSVSIFLETPYSNTTTTTASTTIDWGTLIPIAGSVSIVGVVVILGFWKLKK